MRPAGARDLGACDERHAKALAAGARCQLSAGYDVFILPAISLKSYPCDLCRDTIVGGLPFCKEGMNFADNADSAIKAEDSIQEGSIFCR